MEQYIKKSDLVAEIKRRRSKNAKNKLNLAASFEDNYLLSFLDTLEVKEVDFGTEVYKYMDERFNVYDDGNQTLQTKDKKSLIGKADIENIAKHFFELGMAVSNKQIEEKEDINSLEEECNTVYKDITMIDRDGNKIKARMEQREKV